MGLSWGQFEVSKGSWSLGFVCLKLAERLLCEYNFRNKSHGFFFFFLREGRKGKVEEKEGREE